MPNQILLYGGPPYKSLRSQLPAGLATTASDAGGGVAGTNRIFLFDWSKLALPHLPKRETQAPPSVAASPKSGSSSPASHSESDPATEAAESEAATQATEAERNLTEFVGPAEVPLPTQAGAPPSPLPSAEGSVLLAVSGHGWALVVGWDALIRGH